MAHQCVALYDLVQKDDEKSWTIDGRAKREEINVWTYVRLIKTHNACTYKNIVMKNIWQWTNENTWSVSNMCFHWIVETVQHK